MTNALVASQPTRPRVWWRALLLAAPLFVIGVALGAYVTYDHYTRVQPSIITMFDEHMLSQYAVLQYKEASYPEAQAALERLLQFLAAPASSKNPWSDSRSRTLDAMLTWGRLALLHERNAHPDLADGAWQHAEALATQATWKDPSRKRIRAFLERLDAAPGPSPTPKTGA